MNAILEGLALVAAWPANGLLLLGILLGLFLGAVPGLGGMVGFSLLLPFTFGMEPAGAFALLLGMYAVTTTSDTLTSVLIGVPGSGAGAATVVDGYPMTQKGQAMRALGAAYTSSAIGGVLGALVLVASLPLIRPLIVSFGPPEFFMLGGLGLTMVGALSGRSIVRGLAAAMLGLLFATVGYSTQGGVARYTFEHIYLFDGLKIVPVVLGLFAIPEIIDLSRRGSSIAKSGDASETAGQMWQGIKDALTYRWLLLRGSLIGIYVGFLPGVGASVADWVAYGHAVQSAKDKSQFGKGDVRGIIAPEAANNSVKGSDLVPTIAFGIPGSAPMAILLGAFLIHGLQPGPMMLTTNISFTYSLMWTLMIANVIGALLLMLWSRQLAKLTFVRGQLLVPAIFLFAFMGAWMETNQLGDWITLLGFGMLGLWMKSANWPRPPVILGFVLGPIMERNLDLSTQVLGWAWYGRPWVIVIFCIILFVLVSIAWRAYRGRRASDVRKDALAEVEASPAAEPEAQPSSHPALAFVLAGVFFAAFAAAWWVAQRWTPDARFFPNAVSIVGMILAAAAFVQVGRRLAGSTALGPVLPADEAKSIASLLLFLVLAIAASVLLGQLVALPLTVAVYLLVWAKERWTMALAQAAGAAAVLYFLFEGLIKPIWLEPMVPLPFL